MPGQHPSELAGQQDLSRLQGTVAEMDEELTRRGVLIRQLQGEAAKPPDPYEPGKIFVTYHQEGEFNGYAPFGNGTVLSVDAARAKPLRWTFTPPVNCWAEVTIFVGLVNKTNAAYDYANLLVVSSVAVAFGSPSNQSYKMMHNSVNAFDYFEQTKLFPLNAGVTYALYGTWAISGGTWQHYQGAHTLSMIGKAWVR